MSVKLNTTEHLRMEAVGDDAVILERTDNTKEKTSIYLNTQDILYLAQNMSQFARQLLNHLHADIIQKDPDLVPGLSARVEGAEVNVDIHNTQVELEFRDDFGATSRFALTPELAKVLSDDFAQRVSEIESATHTPH